LENKLRRLYALQQIDSNLDELQELKGDLPDAIAGLETSVRELETQLANHEQTMRGSFALRDNADSEILSLKEKMEKYKQQQLQVRNNREYDALTREMDHAQDAITRLEKEMEMLEGKAVVARNDIETVKKQIEETSKVLEQKRLALAEVSRTTESEELQFNHERQKILASIDKEDLATYERIRKAKKGKAIVSVKRNACGGCFNKVPPQKLLELRQNDRIYTCERCGRILVSDAIAEKVKTNV
jgi:hypothetical protein